MAQENPDARSPKRSYRIEALSKGLRLLSFFTVDRPELRVKDLVELSGLPMPTVFRLVATLEEDGYLERTPSGSVRPGTRVLALGFAAVQGLDLVQVSAAALRNLASETGETVNLGVLYGDQVLFVFRVERRQTALAADIRIGSTVPAVYSSIGKVILAYLDKDQFSSLISENSFSGRWGPRAVRTVAELEEQLASVREDGYLVQREEAIFGLSTIAAPIFEVGGTVSAAVNIAVPSSEYPGKRLVGQLLEPLLRSSREISVRMGGSSH